MLFPHHIQSSQSLLTSSLEFRLFVHNIQDQSNMAVIPNEVTKEKVLNGRLRSLPPPKLSHCIHMEHVTDWVKF